MPATDWQGGKGVGWEVGWMQLMEGAEDVGSGNQGKAFGFSPE